MTAPDYMESVTRQCAFLERLIDEAKTSFDQERSGLLLGMAKEEADGLAKIVGKSVVTAKRK